MRRTSQIWRNFGTCSSCGIDSKDCQGGIWKCCDDCCHGRVNNLLFPQTFNFDLIYYISGPMTGYPNFNYPVFEYVMQQFLSARVQVESPHTNENPQELKDDALWQYMMEMCKLQMAKCQGIILLKGWPQSRGAKRELGWAMEMNWPVYYMNEEQWVINMNREVKRNEGTDSGGERGHAAIAG